MRLTKENVAVFIESESHLQQARELLERYGESFSNESKFFTETTIDGYNRLAYFNTGLWELMYLPIAKQITLSELEEILKGEKDGM